MEVKQKKENCILNKKSQTVTIKEKFDRETFTNQKIF